LIERKQKRERGRKKLIKMVREANEKEKESKRKIE
jgi:hypothetical protein